MEKVLFCVVIAEYQLDKVDCKKVIYFISIQIQSHQLSKVDNPPTPIALVKPLYRILLNNSVKWNKRSFSVWKWSKVTHFGSNLTSQEMWNCVNIIFWFKFLNFLLLGLFRVLDIYHLCALGLLKKYNFISRPFYTPADT